MSRWRSGQRVLGIGAALVAGLGLAACGSSSSGGKSGATTSASASSPAAFQAQANAVCTRAKAALNGVAKPTSISQLKPYVDKEVANLDQAMSQLRALHPPSSQQAAYQRYVSLLAQEQGAVHAARAQIDSGNIPGGLAIFKRASVVKAQAQGAARAAHLQHCV